MSVEDRRQDIIQRARDKVLNAAASDDPVGGLLSPRANNFRLRLRERLRARRNMPSAEDYGLDPRYDQLVRDPRMWLELGVITPEMTLEEAQAAIEEWVSTKAPPEEGDQPFQVRLYNALFRDGENPFGTGGNDPFEVHGGGRRPYIHNVPSFRSGRGTPSEFLNWDGYQGGPTVGDRLSGNISEYSNWYKWAGRLVPGVAGGVIGSIPWINRVLNPEARPGFVGPPSWLASQHSDPTLWYDDPANPFNLQQNQGEQGTMETGFGGGSDDGLGGILSGGGNGFGGGGGNNPGDAFGGGLSQFQIGRGGLPTGSDDDSANNALGNRLAEEIRRSRTAGG